MKRIFLCLLTAIFLSLAVFSASAAGASWYCPKSVGGKQPKTPADLAEALSHGAYYLDMRRGDDAAERVVYLTFDAGYENGNVARVLDVLAEKQVPAAFFVLKHFAVANADLICRMARDGHLICNHTASHKNLSGASRTEIEAELTALAAAVEEAGGSCSSYFRPPAGAYSLEMLDHVASLGYRTVFWSVAYADWDNQRQPSPKKALDLLRARMHNGAVVLLHPTSATNAEILSVLIDSLRAEGYRFASLDELCIAR
ncbi:MAG: polysaccharide deacetylase family protein [Clostridia bacterium]|nr:polysaccharide deacetylase family protein [Clostridia bacterium]